jgi:hypothetical protein
MRLAYSISVGKHEPKRPLERPKRRCENNIRMNLREAGWESVDGCLWVRIVNNGGLL